MLADLKESADPLMLDDVAWPGADLLDNACESKVVANIRAQQSQPLIVSALSYLQ